MSILEDLRARWEGMDEIDRRNFWIAIVGIILVIILIYSLSDTLGVLGGILGGGVDYVNNTVGDINNLNNI